MIHKLLAGKGRMKKVVSLLLCLALLGCNVISSNVTAEAESGVAVVEAVENSETDDAEATTGDESTDESTGTGTADETESVGEEITVTEEQNETVSESGETLAAEESTAETTEEAASNDEMPAVTLEGSADGVNVTINAPEGAFAENVTMEVSTVDVDAFADAVVADCMASDGGTYTVYDAAAVEISFYDVNGTEVQPTTEVEVTLGNLDLNTGDDDLTKYAIIYHMNDDGSMEYIADGNPGESSYTFSASSFSTYGLIIASVEYDAEAIPKDDHGENNSPSTISVYWDTVTVGSDGKTLSANNSTTGVQTVTMDGSTVPHGNGGSGSNSGGLSYTMTYNSDKTATIVITPSTGYYVTFVSVNCCGSGAATSCETYGDGNAFTANFTIDSSGTITINVPLDDDAGFHHDSNSSTYFILIHVSPVPSPLYVQYEYGNVTGFLSDVTGTVFADPDAWTDTDSRNNMVNSLTTGGGVVTDDTQYKYTYATGSESDASSWTHYSNSITSEAEALAASYGYYFAGWEVTYYTDCTDFSFSGVYGSGSSYYQEGVNVPLITHVKLVAVWVKPTETPGSLTITKIFSGLPEGTTVDSITFTVTKDGDSSFETQTVTLSDSNNWSETISNLYAGTYTVTETGYEVDGYSCTTTVNGTAVEGGSASVTLTGTLSSTYNSSTGLYEYTAEVGDATVEFVNTYVVDTAKLILKKEIEGNAGVTTKEFTFTVSYTNSSGESIPETYYLANGDSNESNPLEVKLGTTVTITEASGAYVATATLNGGEIAVTETSGNSTLTFEISEDSTVVVTNTYNVYPDTGVNLDSVPYIALLCGVVVFGAVVLIRRRRRLL